MPPLKPKIKVSILFFILVIDVLFFTVIRNDLPWVYRFVVTSQVQEPWFIISGFIIAIICSSILLYVIYKEIKKSL